MLISAQDGFLNILARLQPKHIQFNVTEELKKTGNCENKNQNFDLFSQKFTQTD